VYSLSVPLAGQQTGDDRWTSKPAFEGGTMKALVLAAMLAAIPTAQSGAAAGVWTAEFNGKTFIKLELHTEGATLAGSINGGDIQVDDHGDLRQVGDLRTDARPIFDVKQQGATVTFSAKDDDDSDQFELRIGNDGHAELRLILTEAFKAELAANGVPAPKPFVLTRQSR
jgi:hypothetical protein